MDVALARRRWMREQGLFDPARLVFIDETWANTSMVRLRGHCERGKRLMAMALATVSPEVMAARAREVAAVDVTTELRLCRVPLLYLAGEQDRVVGPRCLSAIRRVKPEIEVVELPGPHLLLQTRPAEAAGEIAQFIERISRKLPGKAAL